MKTLIVFCFAIIAAHAVDGKDPTIKPSEKADEKDRDDLKDTPYKPSANPPSPIPMRMKEPEWKAPKEYLDMPRHEIKSRDHGCVTFPKMVPQSYHCENIWLKNKYSEKMVSPRVVTLDFQYDGMMARDAAWKPVVTWLEHISAWRVRGCAAVPGGKAGALRGGKLRWLALYNHTQQEQIGVEAWGPTVRATTGTICAHKDFPKAFMSRPHLKLTLKSNHGHKRGEDAMIIWVKGLTKTGYELCVKEFYPYSGYHYDFELHWYAIESSHEEDDLSSLSTVVFEKDEDYPEDKKLNHFYCKNVTLDHGYYPCPSVMLQAVEQDVAVCESPIVAWIAHWRNNTMTVCYNDQRGIMGERKTKIEVQYMIYGVRDKCADLQCPLNKHCIHTNKENVTCGCWKKCPTGGQKVCGTNMVTYDNKCELEKEACEKDDKFSYAHPGPCETMTYEHGRKELEAVDGSGGVYCKVISTKNNVWYPDAKINVQITVNWKNEMTGMPTVHDATASWVEDVTPKSFKACVMEAGRKQLVEGPHVNWFAYQGKMKNIMTQRIEVGDWRTGTHCVPVHQRKSMEREKQWHPSQCPEIQMKDSDKVDQEKWRYDSYMMSKIAGQEQHEWYKRMMSGYGVKKMNLTSGMKLKKGMLLMTVEHTETSPMSNSLKDAVNVWMEYDNATQESYICLRELQNFDGTHKGIHVHWTFINDSMIPGFGYSHHMKFKPSKMHAMYNNYAFCQTKRYVPHDFNLIHGATAFVSLTHEIPKNAAYESMKKFHQHEMEVMRGKAMGADGFKDETQIDSWMMPHMWRANLTGWRPHMRIAKNTDYSAWIEGMNKTHIKVCQKSIFNGFRYDIVKVSLFIMPDRCPDDYYLWKNSFCMKFNDDCANHTSAGATCASEKGFVGAPEDIRDNYFLSYLAGQKPIQLAIRKERGNWIRDSGNPSKSNFTRWTPGYPTNNQSHNCVLQGGRATDFSEKNVKCSDCMEFVCGKPAPHLSCKFPTDYCNGCGRCTPVAPFEFKCECIPPYTGERCEKKMTNDDVTRQPTPNPTQGPTANPTQGPTANPTQGPTANPTQGPTANPTQGPTANPTQGPTANPTQGPTANPTQGPTANLTQGPTANPTQRPTPPPQPIAVPF